MNSAIGYRQADVVVAGGGPGGVSGNFRFRLLDLTVAPTLSLGSVVNHLLESPSQTDVYQFAGTAGQRLYYDVLTNDVSYPGANVMLLNPQGLPAEGPYGYFFSDPLAPYYLVHGLVALAFVALTPAVFTRLGPALGAYVAVSLYVPLTGNALEGIGRYAATLFPAFMLLGTIRSRRVHEAILIGSALVLSLLAGLFAGFYPIY